MFSFYLTLARGIGKIKTKTYVEQDLLELSLSPKSTMPIAGFILLGQN